MLLLSFRCTDGQTGDMTLTLGRHGLAIGSDITLKDNSLVFTCSKDNHSIEHNYPNFNTYLYVAN